MKPSATMIENFTGRMGFLPIELDLMIGNDRKELAFRLEYEMEMFIGRIQ